MRPAASAAAPSCTASLAAFSRAFFCSHFTQPPNQTAPHPPQPHTCSVADRANRGIVNFSQFLYWYAQYLNITGVPAPDENGDVLLPPSGLVPPVCIR